MKSTHTPKMMVHVVTTVARHMHVLCLNKIKALAITIYMREGGKKVEWLTPFESPTLITFCVIISSHNFGLMVKFHAKGW